MKIIIASPPYTERSDGIKMLHFLCHSLNTFGYSSKILLMDTRDPTFQKFISGDGRNGLHPEQDTTAICAANEFDSLADIVIYPEIISNNPANARNVVRYFLNKPGNIFGNRVEINARDFLLSYQSIFYPNSHFLLYYPLVDLHKISPSSEILKLPKNIDLSYIGKGKKYGECYRMPGTVSLDWEKSYEEYLILLKNARYLFTWDPMSGVNVDAINNGCIPILMSSKPWTENEIKAQEIQIPSLTFSEFNQSGDYEANFDLFLKKRDELTPSIKQSQANWPDKIHSFVSALKQHFN